MFPNCKKEAYFVGSKTAAGQGRPVAGGMHDEQKFEAEARFLGRGSTGKRTLLILAVGTPKPSDRKAKRHDLGSFSDCKQIAEFKCYYQNLRQKYIFGARMAASQGCLVAGGMHVDQKFEAEALFSTAGEAPKSDFCGAASTPKSRVCVFKGVR